MTFCISAGAVWKLRISPKLMICIVIFFSGVTAPAKLRVNSWPKSANIVTDAYLFESRENQYFKFNLRIFSVYGHVPWYEPHKCFLFLFFISSKDMWLSRIHGLSKILYRAFWYEFDTALWHDLIFVAWLNICCSFSDTFSCGPTLSFPVELQFSTKGNKRVSKIWLGNEKNDTSSNIQNIISVHSFCHWPFDLII